MRRAFAVVVLSAASIFMVVPVPARAATAPLPEAGTILVQGHGWGHGRGMGQYGAQGLAIAGSSWTQILTHYYSGVTLAPRPATETIRVLVETSPAVVVTSDATFTANWVGYTSSISSDATYRYFRARHVGDNTYLDKGTGAAGPWTVLGYSTKPLRFNQGTSLMQLVYDWGEVRYYHGTVEALRYGSDQMLSINDLLLQQYLYGVVPREMPSSWLAEALKAQATAARSYAVYKKVHAEASGSLYDICTTTSCQSYGGAAMKASPTSPPTQLEKASTNGAVDSTAGMVMLYGGAPILSEYSSSTGGYTAPGTVPYLAAVPDPTDSISPHHDWDSLIGVSEIEATWPSIGRLVSMTVTKRNGYGDLGGRVLEMQVAGTLGTVTISGNDFRSAFEFPTRPDGVQSNWFRVQYWLGQLAAAPTVTPVVSGGAGVATVLMKNVGNTAWAIGGPVRLGTDAPSVLAGPDWISPTRAATVAANVTAPGATSVWPGQVAVFRVPIHAETLSPGTYHETFHLVTDGIGPAGDPFALDLGVVRPLVGVVRGNTWFLRGGSSELVVHFGSATDHPIVGDWDGNGTQTPGVVRGNTWYLNNGFDTGADKVFSYGLASDTFVVGDWNGDGIQSPGVVRGTTWYLDDNFDGKPDHVFSFGMAGDTFVVGDWNGDGTQTPGVVRGTTWYLADGLGGSADQVFAFGSATDRPVVGDWDGNGSETPGVVRGNTWYLNFGFDAGAEVTFHYGLAGDTPVVGDWEGPGPQHPAVVRGTTWYLNNGFDPTAETVFGYGIAGDIPVLGDWDGNGTKTPGVVRGTTWYLNNGFDGAADIVFTFGSVGDIPVVGDWNGDGIDTPGVVRGNTWYLNDGFDDTAEHVFSFGSVGDHPVVGDWDGNGTETPGVVHGTTWSLSQGLDGTPEVTFEFGSGTGAPVAGDWDADGKADPGVFDAGTWSLGFGPAPSVDLTFSFGSPGDVPFAGRWAV